MSQDIFEVGWALCGDCCFEEKPPYFMGFFTSVKHAEQVLEKMKVLTIVGEYQVRACVWAPDGFYIGQKGETQDAIYARVRALESEGEKSDSADSVENILANANVLTEAFPEEFEGFVHD